MSDLERTAQRPGRWRLLGHALAFLVVWPASTVLLAVVEFKESPLLGAVGFAPMLRAASIEALRMWRELLAVGLALVVTTALATVLAGGRIASPAGRRTCVGAGLRDALLVSFALFLGIALELPAALHHPLAATLRQLPVWLATTAIGAIGAALAVSYGRMRASVARHLVATAMLVAAGHALARAQPGVPAETGSHARIVLGLDSLSRRSAGDLMRRLCEERGGAWYERAVTPGLLTNAVWTSLMTSHRPSEHGVFLFFQTPDWRTLPPNLVNRARAAGLHTVSFFGDQLTMQLGADLPFDEDRSGPRGWRQLVTAALKDVGVFLPVALPLLPSIPGAATPANQEGTYAYSLKRELADVFTAGRAVGESLVLAHLDYLHQPRYPAFSELTSEQRTRVRGARVSSIVDRSIDWQYPTTPGEPLDVYRWKIEHLMVVLAETLDATRLLNPVRGNQLVLFSDHGARSGLQPGAFGDEAYYGVPLATFGLPERDTRAPISLLDIPALIGLPSELRPGPAEPIVEYVNVAPEEYGELLAWSRSLPDGGVRMPERALARIGRRLKAYQPYAPSPAYSASATRPAVEREVAPAGLLTRLLASGVDGV